MRENFSADWLELVDRQTGIVTRSQAIRLGLSEDAIDNRLRSGAWHLVHRGVYATFTGDLSREAELWSAVLRAGAGAALSHQTSAELAGLADEPSGIIHIAVPLDRHPEPIRGAVVHRSVRVRQATHPAQLPPRTRVEETVIDLTQTAASRDAACAWMSRAVGRRLTTVARLQSALCSRPKVRWRADLSCMLTDIGAGVHSLLEYRYIRDVERAHGLPVPRRQARTIVADRPRYVDNLYDEARLAVELDGQIAHQLEMRWADVHRDNAHAEAGITTLRYSWTDVTQRPCEAAQQIAAVLKMRGTAFRLRKCGPGCAVSAQRKVAP
jgi:very-short-patch-repair endonuclease